jgi:hypothetical protein
LISLNSVLLFWAAIRVPNSDPANTS